MAVDLVSLAILIGCAIFALSRPKPEPRRIGKGAPVYAERVAVNSTTVARAMRRGR